MQEYNRWWKRAETYNLLIFIWSLIKSMMKNRNAIEAVPLRQGQVEQSPRSSENTLDDCGRAQRRNRFTEALFRRPELGRRDLTK